MQDILQFHKHCMRRLSSIQFLRERMCFLCEYSSEATKQPKLHLFIKISIFTSTLCFSFTIDFATDLDTMKHDIDTDTGYDTDSTNAYRTQQDTGISVLHSLDIISLSNE